MHYFLNIPFLCEATKVEKKRNESKTIYFLFVYVSERFKQTERK